jgi:hypothetical protein
MGSNARRNKVLAVLVAGLMVVAAAACGGGDDGAEVQSTSDATTAERDRSGGSESDLDEALDSLGGLDGDCAQVGLAYATISLGALGAMFGGAMSDDEMQEMEDELADLDVDIPDEIADDFEVLRDAFAEFAEGTSGLSGNLLDPEYQEQLEKAGEALDSPEVEEAQANIEAYLERECPGFAGE